ncbi:MAG: efflux RND transporter permease subunit, partial [Planctomycetota bacterium]
DFDDERGAVAYTLIVGVTWQSESEPMMGILGRTADELADRLRNVPGTDIVRLFGEPSEEITVSISRDEIAQLGFTVPQLLELIHAADSKSPSGMLRSGDKNLVIEVTGDFQELDRISNIPLRQNASGAIVRLGDVATLEKSWRDPPTEIGVVEGKRSVYVAARMLDDRRVDLWMKDAQSVLSQFRSELSPTVELTEVFNQDVYTGQRLGELGSNLVMGAGVVVLVIFFMMGWRSSIFVGLSLPLVSAIVLFAMLVMGIPLHQMSIFGLIVAMGLLIDNAIVTVDEIGSEIRNGHSPREAISNTVSHLFVPLLGSTLTTVVAFLPVFLLPGSLGEFVGPIATTVILALVFSLFVAMTIIPALTGLFSRATSKQTWWTSGISTPRLASGLERLIGFVVRRPVLGLLIALSLPLVGFLRVGDLRNQFFPGADRDQFHIQVWMPRDSSIDATRKMTERMETKIREGGDVKAINWLVGGSAPTVYYNMIMNQDRKPSYAEAVVTAASPDQARKLIPELQRQLDREFPIAQTVVKQLGQGPPVEAPVEIRVYGPSVDMLRKIGHDLQRLLYETPQVVHTQTSFDATEPKMWVETNEVKSRLAGLTLTDIAGQLQTTLEGATGGSVLEQSEELPVRVRFENELRGNTDAIASSRIVTPGGNSWLPLSAIGELTIQPQTPSVHRRNGERSNTIKAYVEADALAPEVTEAFVSRMEDQGYELPSGYRLEVGGDAEERTAAMANLIRYAPVLAVVMLATIVLSFRSFLLAGVLGLVAVMSFGLAFLNLWLADFPLGFNPLIGTAGLIGIALNDSIVVLAQIRTNPLARAGDPVAITNEVMKTTRHVISTTLTTIGGFVPLLLSGGDFWPPLAVVIAGGVGGASILALIFIPSAYALVGRFVETHQVVSPAVKAHEPLRQNPRVQISPYRMLVARAKPRRESVVVGRCHRNRRPNGARTAQNLDTDPIPE